MILTRSNRWIVRAVIGLIGVALLLMSAHFYGATASAGPGAVTVLQGQGVAFNQVDFTWSGATTLNSDTGQVDVSINKLRTSTGMLTGYVNIETSVGWIVQNLPVTLQFPYKSISTNFDLGSMGDVTSLSAFVEFSSDPVTSFGGGSFTTFSVGNTEFNGEGFEGTVSGGAPTPPSAGVGGAVTFQAGGLLQFSFQFGHQNVETAKNQCAPAAVANSLQWLEDHNPGINVPHNNVPGLRGGLVGPVNSLVGQLDLTMGRGDNTTTRQVGPALGANPILKGKLTYLANNGLAGALNIKHQGLLGGGNVSVTENGPDGVPGGGDDITMTSVGQGALVTAAFIISELKDNEDLELGYLFLGGGHFVEIVGAGTILGVPWIAYKSDHVQSDADAKVPPDAIDNNEGTGFTDFSFLIDTADAGASPNLVNEKGVPDAAFLISQSPKPVGGVAELPEVAGTPLEMDGSSGASAGVLAGAIAGAVLVGGVTLGGAAWYTRRRLIK